MENFVMLLIPAFLVLMLIRVLLMPVKLLCKLAFHSGCGFLCLWLLNTLSGISGIYLPINTVTVLIAGFLGVPGIGLITLLEILSQ